MTASPEPPTTTSTGSISDATVKVKPSKALLKLLEANKEQIDDVPENLAKVLRHNNCPLPAKCNEQRVATLSEKDLQVDTELLAKLCDDDEEEEDEKKTVKETPRKESVTEKSSLQGYLHLPDLVWITKFLAQLRKSGKTDLFLHDLLEQCSVQLPQNEVLQRNPELEARCKRLKEQQLNREYRKMTKDVDAVTKHAPEDTIAYQMKAINSQIIAVLQFVFSVIAGFVFGFLGIQLIVGNLDFGFRLLLGIIFALIIALAEIYFLAKKLNEYDVATDQAASHDYKKPPERTVKSPERTVKPHKD